MQPPLALAAGRWQPLLINRLAHRDPDALETRLAIRYLFDRDELEAYRERGYRLFALPYQSGRTMAMYGVDLIAENVAVLFEPEPDRRLSE